MRRTTVRRLSLAAYASAAFLALAAIPANAVDLQPGLWETSSKSERDGIARPDVKKTGCITPEKAKEASSRTSVFIDPSHRGGRSENCKIVDSQKTATGMTWRMQCAGPIASEQTGSFVFDTPRRYTAVIKSTVTAGLRTLTSTLTVEGRRIGECPQ